MIVCYLEENLSTATLSEPAEVLCYSVVYTGNNVKKLFNKPFTKVDVFIIVNNIGVIKVWIIF